VSSSAARPRDPESLVQRLREENTGDWFGPFAAGSRPARVSCPRTCRAALCLALACLPGVRATEGVENVDGVRASPSSTTPGAPAPGDALARRQPVRGASATWSAPARAPASPRAR
jgi:hypothetical protein